MIISMYRYQKSTLNQEQKEIAQARQISMYLARELTNMSLPKIGESFGNRDYTTVMHACDKIKTLIKKEDGRNKKYNKHFVGQHQTSN